jgi:cytochrome c oxidase assembly factor CtaG
MNAGTLLLGRWDWEPGVIFACLLLIAGYAAAVRGRWSREAVWFGMAVALVLVALASPIATLGAHSLLSAHMLQHFILVMLAPPLVLAGIPESVAVERRMRVFRPAVACWLCGIGTMALWHMPALFNSSLHQHWYHAAEQVAFSATAIVFWWPVFGPVRRDRLHPIVAVVYLATACLCCTAIGAAITFSPGLLYPAYGRAAELGISPRLDQQLAGLLMWVPGCLVYLSAMLIRLGEWFAEPEAAPEPASIAAT